MRKLLLCFCLFALSLGATAGNDRVIASDVNRHVATRNVLRAMSLLDNSINKCFDGPTLHMRDLYHLGSGKSEGTADVWPYTAAIEAVNSVMEALTALKDTRSDLYDAHMARYKDLLARLYDNLAYYKGTYTLTSYTQTREWSVYGVHRGATKGTAQVEGIENVYDDQMWIVRELVRAYRNTGDKRYLDEAEYLTEYIIDGWDCTLDSLGRENGGITWGPGYNSKHSCSNAPIVSPLVWLADIYKDSKAKTVYRYIAPSGKRKSRKMGKSEYYLSYAKKVYEWQKRKLLKEETGCYWDMLGADGKMQYETVGGTRYRKHVPSGKPVGTEFTYNSGTMLCGAADLLVATGDEAYRADLTSLAKAAYLRFRGNARTIDGSTAYPFPYDRDTRRGFNAWFDDVLLRAYADSYKHERADEGDGYYSLAAAACFQTNLDFAYDHFITDGFLPNDLLGGWGDNIVTKAFFQLAYAADYATLAIMKLGAAAKQ